MRYEYWKPESAKRVWKDKKKNAWYYLNEEEVQELGITLQNVVGDVEKTGKETESEDVLGQDDAELPITPVKMQLKKNEAVLGYLPCDDEEGNPGAVRIIKKKQRWWLLLLLLLLLLGIGAGVWFYLNRNDDFLDASAIAYQMPDAIKNNNPDEIVIPVITELTMEAGADTVEASFANPDGNPCYFKYTVKLNNEDGTQGEQIYESKYIEPGTAIMEFEPTKKLSPGEYSVEISVKTASLKDREQEMNGGAMDCKLIVE